MCRIAGFSVISLQRIGFAFLTLDGVKEGDFRYLSDQEVVRLKKLAYLSR
jgi:16S rRNA U516 pseudouridylate synthase RsuA-like enzyme